MLQNYEEEFVALDDRVDYDKYVDYKRKLVEHDGKSYGIPFDCGTAALFYRLDILEQAGFSEADMQNLTWSRYMEIYQQVYQKTGIPMLTLDPTDLPGAYHHATIMVKVIMMDDSSQTMPMLVANLSSGYSIDYGVLMLGVLICSLPTGILFLVLQKSFANGIVGAVKG